jgi:hypothetical protein
LKKREEMRRETATENDAAETFGEAGATPPRDARCVTGPRGVAPASPTLATVSGVFSRGAKILSYFFLARCSLVSEGIDGLQDFRDLATVQG